MGGLCSSGTSSSKGRPYKIAARTSSDAAEAAEAAGQGDETVPGMKNWVVVCMCVLLSLSLSYMVHIVTIMSVCAHYLCIYIICVCVLCVYICYIAWSPTHLLRITPLQSFHIRSLR